jgi:saccharopine dehydrogenase-like NADP-dependent oxidoreductase
MNSNSSLRLPQALCVHEAARQVADGLQPAAGAQYVDVTDDENLELLLAGSDACINSVNYYFNLDVIAGG